MPIGRLLLAALSAHAVLEAAIIPVAASGVAFVPTTAGAGRVVMDLCGHLGSFERSQRLLRRAPRLAPNVQAGEFCVDQRAAGVRGMKAVGRDQKRSRMARVLKGKGSEPSDVAKILRAESVRRPGASRYPYCMLVVVVNAYMCIHV